MIQTAIENLADILISEVWGSDEYSVEYTAKLNEAFDTLRRVKRLLG
jgi:hypothetical protein